jgi:hypothetical protein
MGVEEGVGGGGGCKGGAGDERQGGEERCGFRVCAQCDVKAQGEGRHLHPPPFPLRPCIPRPSPAPPTSFFLSYSFCRCLAFCSRLSMASAIIADADSHASALPKSWRVTIFIGSPGCRFRGGMEVAGEMEVSRGAWKEGVCACAWMQGFLDAWNPCHQVSYHIITLQPPYTHPPTRPPTHPP